MTESERHAQIQALVRRIRSETGRAVPDVDPDGPGVTAHVLVVLSDPGRLGALTTNYLSLTNPDETTLNQIRLFAEAGLPTDCCTWWNGVPWDLEGEPPEDS